MKQFCVFKISLINVNAGRFINNENLKEAINKIEKQLREKTSKLKQKRITKK